MKLPLEEVVRRADFIYQHTINNSKHAIDEVIAEEAEAKIKILAEENGFSLEVVLKEFDAMILNTFSFIDGLE